MELERAALPGVGVSHSFVTAAGRRVGVVALLDGRRELVSYDPADPDSVGHAVTLEEDEARTIAELLGTPVLVDRVPELSAGLDGVRAERIPVVAGSPYCGRRFAELHDAQARQGASAVAVVRAGEVLTSPGPAFELTAGDSVVVVGTDAATAAWREALTGG